MKCRYCQHECAPGDQKCPECGYPLAGPKDRWPPGTVIKGDYKIVKQLGKGGIGVTYLAEHVRLQDFRVIKRLHDQMAGDADINRRFQEEGRIQYRLSSCPFIARVDNVTSEDDDLILIMEYVEGGSLADYLVDFPNGLPVEEALRYAADVARGLAAAHRLGKVHRDIKPGNILLKQQDDGSRTVKIIDFGIASDLSGANPTTRADPFATDGYSPLEQYVMKGKDLDGRTDLYSLGMTLYQMLTRRRPFNPAAQWVYSIINETPVAPVSFRPEIARWDGLNELVLELIDKDREKRPKTADEVARRLAALHPGDGESVTRPGPRRQRIEVAPPQPLPEKPLPEAVRRMLDQRTLENPKDGLVYVWIPPGEFVMGASPGDSEASEAEKPAHRVRIMKGFWLCPTPVTVGAYRRFADANHLKMPDAPDYNPNWQENRLPMVNVDWNNARRYCE
jgi:serine/threonine protein kinase